MIFIKTDDNQLDFNNNLKINPVQSIKQAGMEFSLNNDDVSKIKEFSNAIEECGNRGKAWNLVMKDASPNAKAYAANAMMAGKSAKELGNGLQFAGLKATAASVGVGLLNAVLNAGVIFVVTLAIQGLVKAINSIVHASENARKELADARSEYEDNKNELESLNSELETTKQKIAELQSKDKLTLTDDAELKRLQRENDELERRILLQEKKTKISQEKAVGKVRDNIDQTKKDVKTQIDAYSNKKEEVNKIKKSGKKYGTGLASNVQYDIKDIEETIAQEEDVLTQKETDLLNTVEEIEEQRSTILQLYDYDYTKMVGAKGNNDKDLLTQLNSNLDQIYSTLYGKGSSEYQQFVITPIFSMEGVKTSEQELLDYFSNGGSATEKALEENFGGAAVEAMKNACELAGITFDEFIRTLYNNVNKSKIKYTSKGMSSDKADRIIRQSEKLSKKANKDESVNNDITKHIGMSLRKNINSQDDVLFNQKQSKNNQDKLAAFLGLDKYDKKLVLTTEIPDSVKKGTETDFKAWVNKLKEDAKIDVTISTKKEVSELNKIKGVMSSIGTAYGDFASGKAIDVGNLDALKDVEGYKKFANVITKYPEDAQKIQKAFNELATTYIDSTDLMKGLTVANEDYIVSQLKEQGVVNASEFVHNRLYNAVNDETSAQQSLENVLVSLEGTQIANTLAGKKLEEITLEDVTALYSEASAAGVDMTSLYQYMLAKNRASNTILSTSASVQALINLGNELDIETTKLQNYKNALDAAGGTETKVNNSADYYALEGKRKLAEGEKNKILDYKPTQAKVDYNAPASNSGGGGGGGGSKDQKKKYKEEVTVYDWIEKRINYVTNVADKLKNKADDATNKLSKLKESLSNMLSMENDTQSAYTTGQATSKLQSTASTALSAIKKALNQEVKVAQTDAKAAERYRKQAAAQAKRAVKEQVKSDTADLSKKEKAKYYKKYGVNAKGKMTKKQQKEVNKYLDLMDKGKLGKGDIERVGDPVVKAYLDEYQTWLDKSKQAKESSTAAIKEVASLMDTYRETAETMANAPFDVAEEKVNKLGNAFSLLEAKIKNIKVSFKDSKLNSASLFKNYDEQIQNLEDQDTEYQTAATKSKTSYNKSKKTLNKKQNTAVKKASNTKKGKDGTYSGLTKKQLDKVRNILKSGKQIVPETLFGKIQKGTSLYNDVRDYNLAFIEKEANLEAYETASVKAKQSKEETAYNIRQKRVEESEDLKTRYGYQIGMIGHSTDAINDQIGLLESKGALVNRQYYKDLNKNNNKTLKYLKKQKEDLQKILKTIPKGTEEWYRVNDMIEETKSSINQTTIDTQNNINKITELARTIESTYKSLKDNAKSSLDVVSQLASNMPSFDESTQTVFSGKSLYGTGKITQSGLAQFGANYSTLQLDQSSLKETKSYLDQLYKAKEKLEGGASSATVKNALGLTETFSSVNDVINMIIDKEKEVDTLTTTVNSDQMKLVELMREKYQAELKVIKQLIDAKNEELNITKSLHDYQKSIEEKTNNISSLQAQITAVSGDTSEEGQARLQRLQKQLNDAKDDLQETQYDKYISDQQDMLNTLYSNYEGLLTSEMSDVKGLLKEAVDFIKDNDNPIQVAIANTTNASGEKENTYSSKYLTDMTKKEGTLAGDITTMLSQLKTIAKNTESKLPTENPKTTTTTTTKDKSKTTTTTKTSKDKTNKGSTSGKAINTQAERSKAFDTISNFAQSNKIDMNKVMSTGVKDSIANLSTNFNRTGNKTLDNFIESFLNSYVKTHTNIDGSLSSGNEIKVIGDVVTKIDKGISDTESSKIDMLGEIARQTNNNKDAKSLKYNHLSDLVTAIEKVFGNSKYYKKGAKKSAAEYKNPLNKYLFTKNKKVLTDSGLDALLKAFKSAGNTWATRSDLKYLMDEVKRISKTNIKNVGGFSTGGIAKVVKKNNDDGIATIKNGEAVFTPVQTKTFTQEFMPAMNGMIDSAQWLKSVAEQSKNTAVNQNIGNIEAHYEFTLENVTNASDIIRNIQTNASVQKALQEVTINKLSSGSSRLGVNKFK